MKKTLDMTNGSIVKAIILFSVPLILGNLLQQEYAFPDRREEEELSSGWEQEVLNRRKILLRKKVSEEEEEN